MKKGYPCQLIVSVLVVGLLLALSEEATAAEVPRIQGELTIFSAASLTDAFKEMAAQIEQANPGTKLTFNFAGSPTLRTQLAQGARTDVFASADEPNMEGAEKDGTITGQRITPLAPSTIGLWKAWLTAKTPPTDTLTVVPLTTSLTA